MRDEDGREYLDLFAGAGALNYGHNEPRLKQAVIDYMLGDGITHSLDLTTEAKVRFLETFERVILKPRELTYKVMFPGPTGTNAVESALKIARKVTGRTEVVAFTNAFHGMTLGALSLTGNQGKRSGAGVALGGVTRMPFYDYLGKDADSLAFLERSLEDSSSGVDAPAAIIVETVQAEGGLNVASEEWLRRLSKLAKKAGALFIVDDIQAGCGRTGTFFSFEKAGIVPDLVCLSKSLSGFGLPFAATLVRPELDALSPGQHNGTFRGNNLAFVAGARALELFWSGPEFEEELGAKAHVLRRRLDELAQRFGGLRKGRGLIQGVRFQDRGLASAIAREAFERGVIIETSGAEDEVLKVLPALTIPLEKLEKALSILQESAQAVVARKAEAGPKNRLMTAAFLS